jgi:hypothetical protein
MDPLELELVADPTTPMIRATPSSSYWWWWPTLSPHGRPHPASPTAPAPPWSRPHGRPHPVGLPPWPPLQPPSRFLFACREIKLEEAAILHYTYTRFSGLTSMRDRCGCKPTKEGVKRCFILEFDRLNLFSGLTLEILTAACCGREEEIL